MEHNDGYRRLATEVLQAAMKEARLDPEGDQRMWPPEGTTQRRRIEEALAFLTTESPLLNLWCAWLDLNPEDFRLSVRRLRLRAVSREGGRGEGIESLPAVAV